ncbi:MAG: hypothetical protein IBX58_13655 [Roseovarius sp.]|nr:hypothetical protein [Roseovarius sp.]
MQDETDNTASVANDTTTLEADVCSAVERGRDVQKIVRQLDAPGVLTGLVVHVNPLQP